jgi:hypothetical protein
MKMLSLLTVSLLITVASCSHHKGCCKKDHCSKTEKSCCKGDHCDKDMKKEEVKKEEKK